MSAGTPNIHASATGQALTGAAWLDDHFEASRPEYEAQLRAVGIHPGWRVLDAACGSGSFLPWLAELVGPTGHLAALDLAPDNVAVVEQRVAISALSCPVEARVGTVLDLPYADDSFDAVWFANTSQYLTDAELATALAEFRRVVRPGGLVAVKDADGAYLSIAPAPPGLVLRLVEEAVRLGSVQSAGTLRTPLLGGWLRRAGLVDVWRHATLIERSPPFDATTHRYWRGALTFFTTAAAGWDLPEADRQAWEELRDPDGLDRFLDDPDTCLIDANVLAVGRVPAVG
jgi:ubiquinone/menaquinone biosynthesis C-methylase UbiE